MNAVAIHLMANQGFIASILAVVILTDKCNIHRV